MIQIGLAMVSFGISIFVGMKIIGGKIMDDAMKLIIDIWNSLSPEDVSYGLERDRFYLHLKNGRYAAKKSHK